MNCRGWITILVNIARDEKSVSGGEQPAFSSAFHTGAGRPCAGERDCFLDCEFYPPWKLRVSGPANAQYPVLLYYLDKGHFVAARRLGNSVDQPCNDTLPTVAA
jgi:hypothetical protein